MFEAVEKLPDWHKDAECQRNWNPELWWYENPHNSNISERQEVIFKTFIALEYCESCPVKNQCLAEGIKTENLHPGSIWGGMLYSERLRVSTKRGYSRRYNERWLRAGVERLKRQRQGITNAKQKTNDTGDDSRTDVGMGNTNN